MKKFHFTLDKMLRYKDSILEEENEAVVRKALQKVKARVIPIETDAFSEVPLLPVRIEGTMCVCPDARYEGFFVAKLRL